MANLILRKNPPIKGDFVSFKKKEYSSNNLKEEG